MPEKVDLTELGNTGLPRYGGYVYDEILPELSGLRWRRIVREMATNDPKRREGEALGYGSR